MDWRVKVDNSTLEKIIDEQLGYCADILISKGKEYALDSDRLLAFKKAGALQGNTPKQALLGMLSKHLVSITDMCLHSETEYPIETWAEKITDSMNYLILLKALVIEEQDVSFGVSLEEATKAMKKSGGTLRNGQN